MVKPPKIRHSKSRKEPLTIELGPDEVSRIDDPARAATDSPPTDDGKAGTVMDEVAPASADSTGGGKAADMPAEGSAPGTESSAGEAIGPKPAGSDRLSEDEADNLMGSEWPPESPDKEDPPPSEEERVRHAFGRDPDTPPPGASARAESSEPRIEPKAEPRRGLPFAAGIAGGVIALLGAGLLQWAELLPSPGAGQASSEEVAALRSDIDALKQEVAAVKAAPGADTTALSQSVSDLSGALDQAKADIAALKDAVSQGAAGEGAAVQALNQKLGELEASLAALKESVDQGAGGGDALETLNQKLDALQSSVVALEDSGASRAAIDAINEKLAGVEASIASAVETAKAGEARIATLEQTVASLSDRVASQASQPKVALAIAAAALKSAIERGGTFTAEVETFAAIAPDAPELPQLRDIAAKGVASRSELVEGMDEAANAMIGADQALPSDAGFWDSLWASAESLVKVRPIGAVEGETVPAKVARMEVAVKAGDLAKALAEYDTLPDAPKAAGQAFADRIRARIAAEELVAKALAGAMNAT